MNQSSFGRVRLLSVVAIALATAIFVAFAPGRAMGAEGGASRIPDYAAATYGGWAYLADEAATAQVPAWRWTATGWVATKLYVGQPVWAQPFAAGWHWASIGTTWYAVRTSVVARWSCAQTWAAWPATQAGLRIPVYAWNTTRSRLLGYTRPTTGDGALCENAFPEATVGHTVYPALPPCPLDATQPTFACANIPTPFMLVRVQVDPCQTATGRRAGCYDPLTRRVGYVRLRDVYHLL